MTEQFKKQLEDLINANGVDTLCNKPDYVLAEMVCKFLEGVKNDDVFFKKADVIKINEKGQVIDDEGNRSYHETIYLC